MGSRSSTLGKRRKFGAEPRKIEESCQQYRDLDTCLPDNTGDKRFQGRDFVIQVLTRVVEKGGWSGDIAEAP